MKGGMLAKDEAYVIFEMSEAEAGSDGEQHDVEVGSLAFVLFSLLTRAISALDTVMDQEGQR